MLTRDRIRTTILALRRNIQQNVFLEENWTASNKVILSARFNTHLYGVIFTKRENV